MRIHLIGYVSKACEPAYKLWPCSPEAEEQVERVRLFKVTIEFWIHDREELLERQELFLHSTLVSEEIPFLI